VVKEELLVVVAQVAILVPEELVVLPALTAKAAAAGLAAAGLAAPVV
jgi:hypothetical protein